MAGRSILPGLAAEGLRFHVVDAQGQVVGRLASQIAQVLMGKTKPTYTPNVDCGDPVVVVNADKVDFTGKKWDDKLYRWHTGYPGGLKERNAKDQLARDPGSIIEKAVMGMLPKNNLRRAMARKLRIYAGPEHGLEGQVELVPMDIPRRNVNVRGPILKLTGGFVPFNPEAYHKRFGPWLARQAEKKAARDAAKAERKAAAQDQQ